MRPLIGVSASVIDRSTSVSTDNIHAVLTSGGLPFILPNVLDLDAIDMIAEKIDGLLLTGGGDIDPTLFDEEPLQHLGRITPERDFFERMLIQRLLILDKPILAICRGCQILNIAAGGDMYQDIYTQIESQLLQHSQQAPRDHGSHFVNIEEHSALHSIVKEQKFKVNSFHHQAVRNLAKGFRKTATASDGVIEAFESREHLFVHGIQWHPECMLSKDDQPSQRIFTAFIQAAKTE